MDKDIIAFVAEQRIHAGIAAQRVIAEAAIQVMGKAGDHQVPGARKALGHAYGGGSQYYSMWVVGSDKPTG